MSRGASVKQSITRKVVAAVVLGLVAVGLAVTAEYSESRMRTMTVRNLGWGPVNLQTVSYHEAPQYKSVAIVWYKAD